MQLCVPFSWMLLIMFAFEVHFKGLDVVYEWMFYMPILGSFRHIEFFICLSVIQSFKKKNFWQVKHSKIYYTLSMFASVPSLIKYKTRSLILNFLMKWLSFISTHFNSYDSLKTLIHCHLIVWKKKLVLIENMIIYYC